MNGKTLVGVCGDAGQSNLLGPSLVRATGTPMVRMVVTPQVDARAYMASMPEIDFWLIFAKESLWSDDWETVMQGYAERYGPVPNVRAVSGGNEANADPSSTSSFFQTPQDYIRLNEVTFRHFSPYSTPQHPIARIGGALAQYDLTFLDPVKHLLFIFDGISVNPYGRYFYPGNLNNPGTNTQWGFGSMHDLLANYHAYFNQAGYGNLQVWVGEWGINAEQWGQDAQRIQQLYVRDGFLYFTGPDSLANVACFFCLSDTMVYPFGLVDSRVQAKLAFYEYRKGQGLVSDSYTIGDGVRKAMAKLGDSPRSDEEYHHTKFGATSYSETQGLKHTYRWTPQDGTMILDGSGNWIPV